MSLELFDLTGKTALITGSSRGLGKAIAEGLAKAGATVILNGVEESRLQESVAEFREKGLICHGYAFRVNDAESIAHQVTAMEADVAPIDILINNAGIQIRNPLESFNEADWDRLMDTNLKGVYLTSQRVAQGMIARKKGKIINIGSIQCELARPGIAPYAAAKAGVKMLTQAMATEWGKHNIQSNGIGPGYFQTDMTQALVDDPDFNAWVCNRTPAGRWGHPEELIGAAIFLASDAANYVNGHFLYVDGGMLACV